MRKNGIKSNTDEGWLYGKRFRTREEAKQAVFNSRARSKTRLCLMNFPIYLNTKPESRIDRPSYLPRDM